MLLLIDNYDSFTYNLVHFLGDLGARCTVHRNDQITVDQAMALVPDAIVLSPGPCTPNEAGICMDLIKAAAKAQLPLLGVCLGHQALGEAFGAVVERAPENRKMPLNWVLMPRRIASRDPRISCASASRWVCVNTVLRPPTPRLCADVICLMMSVSAESATDRRDSTESFCLTY